MTESATAPTGAPTGGARGGAFTALRPLAMIFLALGVLQIFLAGFGVFDLHGAELGSDGETAFDPHRMVGGIMALVALLILIAAAVARPSGRVVGMAAGLLIVVAVLQNLLGRLGEDTAFFGGLHALFGIGALGMASAIMADAKR